MPRIIIHVATGEFRDEKGRLMWEPSAQGWSEAGCPPPSAPGYAVIVVATKPDQRTQRWSGSDVVTKTVAEIAAYDSALKDARANTIDADAALQAVAQLDFEERQKLQVKAGQSLRSAADCKARLKVIYRGLLT